MTARRGAYTGPKGFSSSFDQFAARGDEWYPNRFKQEDFPQSFVIYPEKDYSPDHKERMAITDKLRTLRGKTIVRAKPPAKGQYIDPDLDALLWASRAVERKGFVDPPRPKTEMTEARRRAMANLAANKRLQSLIAIAKAKRRKNGK